MPSSNADFMESVCWPLLAPKIVMSLGFFPIRQQVSLNSVRKDLNFLTSAIQNLSHGFWSTNAQNR